MPFIFGKQFKTETLAWVYNVKLKVLNYGRSFGFENSKKFDIAGNCGQMRLMWPQLSRCGFGDFKNLDVTAAIAIADRNLKLWQNLADFS